MSQTLQWAFAAATVFALTAALWLALAWRDSTVETALRESQ
ncbi:hypothetical protein [Nannocystis pusilla]